MAAINLTSGHKNILCTENNYMCTHMQPPWGWGGHPAGGGAQGSSWWREAHVSLTTSTGRGRAEASPLGPFSSDFVVPQILSKEANC